MGPLIAIVGRPNVGKSSLFNKLIGEDIALIADFPGLTRDRNYSGCKIDNSDYILVDTGGITNSSSKFDELISDYKINELKLIAKRNGVQVEDIVGKKTKKTTWATAIMFKSTK